MRYFVHSLENKKYGPVDIPTLQQWVLEGRILPTTLLEAEYGGEMFHATSLPALSWPGQVPPATGIPTYAPIGEWQTPYPRYDTAAVLPDTIRKKWNWGAFMFSWVWGLNHQCYWPLLSLVPYVGFLVRIWCGIKGNQWAWESKRFSTPEQMEAVQVIWAKWALGVAILSLGFGVFALVILIASGDLNTR